jgi:hypothetical protein
MISNKFLFTVLLCSYFVLSQNITNITESGLVLFSFFFVSIISLIRFFILQIIQLTELSNGRNKQF